MSDIQTNVIKPSVIFTENDIDYKNIGEGFESNLDNKYQAILDFIKNNNGKGKTELEKDSLYKSAQELCINYTNVLNDQFFNQHRTDGMREHDIADESIVFHFAASASVPKSFVDPAHYYENNVFALDIFLKQLQKHRISGMVFSSSSSVYGATDNVPPYNEEMATVPMSPYATTKVQGEQLLFKAAAKGNINAICLRYFNVAGAEGYGHRPDSDTTQLIPNIIAAHLEGRLFKVYGGDYDTPDGTAIRDYTHVTDVVTANVLAGRYMAGKGRQGIYGKWEPINIGGGIGYSILEVIKMCSDVIGEEVKYEIVDRRKGDPHHVVADITKAKEMLGWQPTKTLRDIVQSEWDWQTGSVYEAQTLHLYNKAMGVVTI